MKNRIIGHGEMEVDQIMFNPDNWRIHPIEQRRALQGLMRDVGVVQEVIVNKTTGNLVDGHLRAMIADEEGEKNLPVTFVELSEHEERLVLLAKDRIGGLAGTDQEKAQELLEEILEGANLDDADLRAVLLDFQDELLGEEFMNDDEDDMENLTSDTVGPQDMELQPQEHYDYIIVLARNLSDWELLCAKLDIKKVNSSIVPGKKRIGLGRAVSAERLLDLIDG